MWKYNFAYNYCHEIFFFFFWVKFIHMKIKFSLWKHLRITFYPSFETSIRYVILLSSSLPLDALPLFSANTACSFIGTATMGSSQSGIAPQLKRLQLSAICRCGRSGYWYIGKTLLALVIPEHQVVLAQLYKYHHQSSKVISGKLVWKQHKSYQS